MEELLGGKLNTEAVAEFTGQLWFIYEALERAVRAIEDQPLAGSIVDRRLERQVSLEADLAGMYGANWRDAIRILPATMKYVSRLEELTGTGDPVPVIAHHYVRYLGDVSGGQVIAARLGTYYDIDPESLNFYDFSAIGKIPPYRSSYRTALAIWLSGTALSKADVLCRARVSSEKINSAPAFFLSWTPQQFP